jgi:hypothetical protein
MALKTSKNSPFSRSNLGLVFKGVLGYISHFRFFLFSRPKKAFGFKAVFLMGNRPQGKGDRLYARNWRGT